MTTRMLPEALKTRAEAYLRPISEDSPAGENAKFDPRHEAVRSEVAKLDMPAGGEVNWEKVVSDGSALLEQTSKDLLIAAYVGFGLFQTQRLDGLVTGLAMLTTLIDNFWDGIFPTRIRGRVNALSWFLERVTQQLEGATPKAEERLTIEALLSAADTLSEVVRARYEDAAPALRPLLDGLSRAKMSLPPSSDSDAKANTAADSGAEGAAPSDTDAEEDTAPTEPAKTPEPSAAQASPPAPESPEKSLVDVSRWTHPIEGASPAGENAKFDPRHEAVRAEVTKLDMPAGGEVNWEKVVSDGSALLEQTSKDLLIAAHVAYALGETKGLEGLLQGVVMLCELSERFWEPMFPPVKRLRGRANAIGWFVSRATLKLDGLQPAAKDEAVLKALMPAVKRLAQLTRDKLDEHAPAVRPLIENAERALLSVPKPKAPTPSPAPVPTSTPSNASVKSAPVRRAPIDPGDMPTVPTATLENAEAVVGYLKNVGSGLIQAAEKLRRADSSDPTAYRVLRNGLWMHLLKPPPSEGISTKVPPLPEPLRSRMLLMAQNQKWAPLLDETESSLPKFRFCMDLHRYTAQALRGLGASHAAALQAVETEVLTFVRRFEGLLELECADGTPLADQETRDWLGVLVPSSEGSGQPALEGMEADTLTDAEVLAKKGQLGEALALIESCAAAAQSGLVRFRIRLRGAQLALEGGRADIARALHEGLDKEVEQHGLEAWDGALCATHLKGFLKCVVAESKGQRGLPPEAGILYRRLVRLDPVAAMRVKL